MALVNRNDNFGTQVEALAPRISIDWDPVTNDGRVLFNFENITTNVKTGQILERAFLGVLPTTISELLAGNYQIVDPYTGHTYEEPAWKLMALIKAATDKVYHASIAPKPEPTDERLQG